MSWQHRDYAGEHEYRARRPAGRGPGMHGLSVTTTIIIANAVIAFLTFNDTGIGEMLVGFGIMQADAVLHGQVWRLFTATYLHANFSHILFNMLALYFLGPALEHAWGRRQFFIVYTLGGIAGYVLLTLAGLAGFLDRESLGVGASGSVLTLLGAAAVLFPNAKVYVYFLFPVRIRTCVIVYGIWYTYNIFQQGANYGGDMCHIAGLVFGLAWTYKGGRLLSVRRGAAANPSSMLGKLGSKFNRSRAPRTGAGAWGHRMQQRRVDEETIDRILAKVHEQGVGGLTQAERDALTEATLRRRADDERIDQMGRERKS